MARICWLRREPNCRAGLVGNGFEPGNGSIALLGQRALTRLYFVFWLVSGGRYPAGLIRAKSRRLVVTLKANRGSDPAETWIPMAPICVRRGGGLSH